MTKLRLVCWCSEDIKQSLEKKHSFETFRQQHPYKASNEGCWKKVA